MSRGLHWFARVSAAVVVAALGVDRLQAAQFSIVDGEGFESPSYTTTFGGTGMLEGQFASTTGGFGSQQWAKSGGAGSTAVVQDAVAKSGSQAVRVDKGDGPDAFWGIQQSGYPDAGFNYVCIEWDMLVESAGAPVGPDVPFGPYFGVPAYDNETVAHRLGYLGVDAQTGEVLYSEPTNGFFDPTGDLVTLGEWHKYQLILDYTSMKYSGTVDGVEVVSGIDFVDGPTSVFTDANISAIAASNDAYYMGLTGTAYFDNFSVTEFDTKIPEPTAFAMLVLVTGLAATRRRR